MNNWFQIEEWEPRFIGEMLMATIDGVGMVGNTDLVTTQPQVYNVVKKQNGFIFVYIGTAPIGTACDPNNTVNGKYVVPVSEVTWAGSVKPVVVVGTC